ncbi:thioredoxin domain-containing protein [Aurantimonas sp. MSK8Z-1]|uniref:thioredoxin domain-containing protein n=1 Tax=Mangrovibrevibacter kandeliae TaxID=2968473 RepID=UPI002119192A|nr:thioredoxin domain-containing protein [Aurantimonas sp. MSK8Z-1]MCW4115047.1 thioredoxin domain-containing protein [Aurantimonas sp. MSK8Z-1]
MRDTGNQLDQALSPYLQQHRDNLVHWREWSEAALDEAKATGKPVLLSVGYAACHWCHVMAHESFEDPQTAALMNRLFVNIKVDREERPDIDHIYMTALHAMGEHGGWPMTMFLTPEGKPFWGGTYFPKQAMHGRPSFTQVLEAVAKAWEDKQTSLSASAADLSARLDAFLSAGGTAPGAVPPDLVARAAEKITGIIDRELGGIKGAPKFPNAAYMEVIARGAFPAGPAEQREAFLVTLRSLCNGGIYDHVGGGLHRYSTDDRWLVPHFEKMLYDNAQFLRHLVWGWRATGDALFERRIAETIGWLSREMRLPDGGFAASLDADSPDESGHAEEGAYYVWRSQEIDALLGVDAAEFARAFDVSPAGNWEGSTILHRLHPHGEGDGATYDEERAKLLEIRERRAPPGRDDKVLADWNGLLIRALAEVAVALEDGTALRLAEDAFRFVTTVMVQDGRLRHAWRDEKTAGNALSSDYGAMIAAAVALFAATGEPAHLEQAHRLAEALERWHGDGQGGHYLTASDARDVILRPRGDQDDAVPGGTALVVEALTMLAQISGDPAGTERARTAAEAAFGRRHDAIGASPALTSALDRFVHGSELAIVGYRSNPGMGEMVAAANTRLDLSRIDLRLRDTGGLPEDLPLAAFRPERYPAALLCRDQACRPPIYEIDQLCATLLE